MFGAAQRLSAPSERMLTLPLASGVYRGLAKIKMTPRKPKCDNVLDNFDVIGGASGGTIAATMYCYSKSKPSTFLGTDDPDPTKITEAKMEAEPAPYGKMLTKPALCCPLSTCCLPVAAWALIDTVLGTRIRALGCGKWVGCGCYPCATGFGLAFVEFMFANFIYPLGISRGSTDPPSRPEAPLTGPAIASSSTPYHSAAAAPCRRLPHVSASRHLRMGRRMGRLRPRSASPPWARSQTSLLRTTSA